MALSAIWLATAIVHTGPALFQQSGEAPPSSVDTVPPESATGRSRSRPLAPINQIKWVRKIFAEYPAEAERNGWTGTVSFTVTVTPQGRATDCIVTASSGNAVTDIAACEGLTRHARFAPARDEQGKAVAGKWMSRITYSSR